MRSTLHAAAAAAITATLAACATMPQTDLEDAATMETAGGMTSLAPPHAPIIEGESVEVVAHPNQLALLESDDPQLEANKRLVHEMWRGLLTAGHLEVGEALLAEDYMQHNPMARTGRAAVLEFFSGRERMEEIPEEIPGLVTIIAEDDMVGLAFVRELPDPRAEGETYTTTWFDWFRIEDGLVAEHWDPATLPPGFPFTPPSEGGALTVTGASGADQLPLLEADDPTLEANKRLVFDVWRGLVEAYDPDTALAYLNEDYIQHNPNAATGRAGVIAYFSTLPEAPIEDYIQREVIDVIAEGDLVMIAFPREMPVPGGEEGDMYTTTWFDMFRIEGDRIAEHWDVATVAERP